MLRKNIIRVLAVAAFCSLPYSLVANVNTASAAGIEMQDTIQSSLNLVNSGNASYSERVGSSFANISYHYAVYSGNDSAFVAITAQAPDNYYWADEQFTLTSQNDPFSGMLPNNNWKSQRIVNTSGDQVTIYEYREVDKGQDATTLQNNAKAVIQKTESPYALATKPKGTRLNDSQIEAFLPELKERITEDMI